jgi:hypothetical protein
MLGFVVIVILYATVGLMAAAGAIRAEQVFYWKPTLSGNREVTS